MGAGSRLALRAQGWNSGMHTNQEAAGRGVLQRPGSQVGGGPDPEMPPRLRPNVQSWTGVTPSHLHCPALAMSLQRGGGEAGAKATLPIGQWEDEPLGRGFSLHRQVRKR